MAAIDVSPYMERDYGLRPCWPLVVDVYQRELGLPVTNYRTVNDGVRDIAAEFELRLQKNSDGFVEVAEPTQWAVVFLGKTERMRMTHAGVVIDGRVLHATDGGVFHEEFSTLRTVYPLRQYWILPGLLLRVSA